MFPVYPFVDALPIEEQTGLEYMGIKLFAEGGVHIGNIWIKFDHMELSQEVVSHFTFQLLSQAKPKTPEHDRLCEMN